MIRKLFPHVLKGIFNSICHISHMNTSTHLLESFFVSFCGSTGATVSCFSSGFDLSCCCAALEDDWGASSSFTGFSGFSEVVKKNNYSVNIFKSNNYCSSFWVTFVCRKTACTSINVETLKYKLNYSQQNTENIRSRQQKKLWRGIHVFQVKLNILIFNQKGFHFASDHFKWALAEKMAGFLDRVHKWLLLYSLYIQNLTLYARQNRFCWLQPAALWYFFKNLLAHSLIIFHHGEEHIQLWCFY